MGAAASKQFQSDKAKHAATILSAVRDFDDHHQGEEDDDDSIGTTRIFKKKVLLAASEAKRNGHDIDQSLSHLTDADFEKLGQYAKHLERTGANEGNDMQVEEIVDEGAVENHAEETGSLLSYDEDDLNENDESELESSGSILIKSINTTNEVLQNLEDEENHEINNLQNHSNDLKMRNKKHHSKRKDTKSNDVRIFPSPNLVYPTEKQQIQQEQKTKESDQNPHPHHIKNTKPQGSKVAEVLARFWDADDSASLEGKLSPDHDDDDDNYSYNFGEISGHHSGFSPQFSHSKGSAGSTSLKRVNTNNSNGLVEKNNMLNGLQRQKVIALTQNAQLEREVEALQKQLEKMDQMDKTLDPSPSKDSKPSEDQKPSPRGSNSSHFVSNKNLQQYHNSSIYPIKEEGIINYQAEDKKNPHLKHLKAHKNPAEAKEPSATSSVGSSSSHRQLRHRGNKMASSSSGSENDSPSELRNSPRAGGRRRRRGEIEPPRDNPSEDVSQAKETAPLKGKISNRRFRTGARFGDKVSQLSASDDETKDRDVKGTPLHGVKKTHGGPQGLVLASGFAAQIHAPVKPQQSKTGGRRGRQQHGTRNTQDTEDSDDSGTNGLSMQVSRTQGEHASVPRAHHVLNSSASDTETTRAAKPTGFHSHANPHYTQPTGSPRGTVHVGRVKRQSVEEKDKEKGDSQKGTGLGRQPRMLNYQDGQPVEVNPTSTTNSTATSRKQLLPQQNKRNRLRRRTSDGLTDVVSGADGAGGASSKDGLSNSINVKLRPPDSIDELVVKNDSLQLKKQSLLDNVHQHIEANSPKRGDNGKLGMFTTGENSSELSVEDGLKQLNIVGGKKQPHARGSVLKRLNDRRYSSDGFPTDEEFDAANYEDFTGHPRVQSLSKHGENILGIQGSSKSQPPLVENSKLSVKGDGEKEKAGSMSRIPDQDFINPKKKGFALSPGKPDIPNSAIPQKSGLSIETSSPEQNPKPMRRRRRSRAGSAELVLPKLKVLPKEDVAEESNVCGLWTDEMDCNWAEVQLLLRKKIENESDMLYTVASAEAGILFTEEMDAVANELNVLRGAISRWILPFDNNTRIDAQCSTPHSVVENMPEEFKGKLSERQVHYLVAGANGVRRLVRIKIADDNDLEQARRALKTTSHFFKILYEQARKNDLNPFDILKKYGSSE